ncbi:MAG: type II toxin-antitoxin system HicA family toxin [Crocosphaera sp.]|nr:type II toxin-antitoxin system HicA family toxin [Crocosphaera sp.]
MIFRILRKTLSYRQIAVIFGRLIIIEFLLLGFSILAISKTYQTYYNYTFLPSQKVNHDILSPTLPLALSSAIINNQTKDITTILNSNYGLWKLVITDVEGKKIINYSDKNLMNESDWIENISNENLQKYAYRLLLKPSLLNSKSFDLDFQQNYINNQTIINPDLILGRVYYVSNIYPNFQEELFHWLQNPFEKNNRFPTYNLTILLFIIAGLLLWSFVEYFLFYRLFMIREKEQLFQKLELEKALFQKEVQTQQLELEKKLKRNLQYKIEQNLYFIEQQEKKQKELETLDSYQTEHIQNLQATIDEYEQEILRLEKLQDQSQELEDIKQEKNNLSLKLEEKKQLEEKNKKHIESLKDKINKLMVQKNEVEEKINNLQEVQISNKISLKEREEAIQKEFERQINVIKSESQYAFEEAQNLEEEKDKLIMENQQLKHNLNAAIEKSQYLEFALKKFKQEVEIIKNQPDTTNNNLSIPTSYLTNISSKKAIKAFKKLGFEKNRYHGDHIILKKAETTTVPIPHPRQELNPLTLKNILIQTNTSLEDFLNNL